jgi:hypothetical protein
MSARGIGLAAAVVLLLPVVPQVSLANVALPSADTTGCTPSAAEVDNLTGLAESTGFNVQDTESTDGSSCGGGGDGDPYEYRKVENKCGTDGTSNFCGAIGCGDPDLVGYYVERRLEGSNDPWEAAGTTCEGPDGPLVTPGLVLEALHRIGLPDAELQTEPGFKSGKTLVNFDTNFYTTAHAVTETFTLLGEEVTLEATPASYTWHFDSGDADQTRTTTTPGAPYPDMGVTYAYDDAHTTVHPSVDVTYTAQFSVNGGTWQAIPEAVTIQGDPISRYVAEATGALTEMN